MQGGDHEPNPISIPLLKCKYHNSFDSLRLVVHFVSLTKSLVEDLLSLTVLTTSTAPVYFAQKL